MANWLAGLFLGFIAFLGSLIGGTPTLPVMPTVASSTASAVTQRQTTPAQTQTTPANSANTSATTNTSAQTSTLAEGQAVLTDAELLAMAGNPYASGNVPLGDYKYVTDAPKKGYIYLCHPNQGNGGSNVLGPWMSTATWNFLEKVAVSGAIVWPNATFTQTLTSAVRSLVGNDLPINGITTGTFPIQKTDAAYQYDQNPNTISAQTLDAELPADPQYSATPYCMGGEVGIMTDGVALFDGFDAGLRDAPAHELQDSCDGHPQGSGEYHYHSLSACFKDINETTVLGFAYDGFPITGPLVAPGKYLTTDDLDECHGITSAIMLDGKLTTTYHYVMTQDFPYSASCFRGKPITTGPTPGTTSQQSQGGGSASQGSTQTSGTTQGGPPQAAIDACNGHSVDSACTMSTPNGTLSGTCRTPPNSSLACIPD